MGLTADWKVGKGIGKTFQQSMKKQKLRGKGEKKRKRVGGFNLLYGILNNFGEFTEDHLDV
jgi:hypothetical protein